MFAQNINKIADAAREKLEYINHSLLRFLVLANFILNTTETKMNLPIMQLFFRGILCNLLVTLAIWMSFKVKSDTAKLILIFWCLFAFVASGFEHSIANESRR